MRRIESILSVSLGLGMTAVAVAQDDAPLLLPPVTAPAAAPATEPSAGTSAPAGGGTEAAPPAGGRNSVLAIPGLTPSSRPAPRASLEGSALPQSSAAGESPALVGPSEMPAPAPSRTLNRAPSERVVPENRGTTLELESVPGNDPSLSTSDRSRPEPERRPARADVNPSGSSRTAAKPRVETPTPSPRRAPGLFGRFFPAPSMPSRAANTQSSVKVEPRTDPASDATVKRRIEHQIRTSFGDRLDSVEVRVVGRNVTIRGRAVRFWQRRNLKRSLESMSSLSGLRSTVEVD